MSWILAGCALIVLVAGATADEKMYTVKFDDIDLDPILKNERLLTNYVNCLLDRGPCTPDGKELKDHLPDAIKTSCAKCSETQKEKTKKVIIYLIEHKPEIWKELTAKYDPNGTFRKMYEDLAKKEGIDLPKKKK